MDVTAKDWIDLLKAALWPAAALVGMFLFRAPLSDLLRTIGRRATKLSLFKVEVELAKLQRASIGFDPGLDQFRNKFVSGEDALVPVAAATMQAEAPAYVVVTLGDRGAWEWLTSRLFLFAAFLENSRAVRCIVFTGTRDSFIGAATPHDIRTGLATKFPEYEKEFLSAYGHLENLDVFRTGEPRQGEMSTIYRTFLQSPIQKDSIPAWGEIDRWVYWPGTGGEPQIAQAGETPSSVVKWELAQWVTADDLRVMLGERLVTASVTSKRGAVASEDAARDIVRQQVGFVALLGPTRQFERLCDRSLLVDRIARDAVEA
jgi:hypothetical protein